MYKNKFLAKGTILFLSLLFLLSPEALLAQRLIDKNRGSHFNSKKGYMDGNLVQTVYYNFGEIADWLNDPTLSGVWPKGTNHTYVDGVAVIVQAETKDPQGKTIHPLETNYYEYTRHDVATGVTYGWWPLPGYANPYQPYVARSDDPNTWPLHWPDRPSDWDGKWNGFFGNNVRNADLETYFVFDDNEDKDYILKNNFHPDAEDPTRGGLGLQVHARGFQWSQVLAEDVIFWYYEITNMGTTDYQRALFAQYVDWGIGGHDNSSNNAGNYDALLNISYAYSVVPFGTPGSWSPVGIAGYAFLESPGIPDDNKDNDEDGLTDEKRDNVAQNFINLPTEDPFLRDPARDTLQFQKFYGYSWRPHWDADENCNWRSFNDLNANGKWDAGEPLNDDVGSDGIGPYDEGYTGPDPNGTEANGRPDQGEPNFGILDKDESDQLGLTGFLIAAVHTYDLNNDEHNWQGLSALPPPRVQSLVGVNLANYFSSYFIHLQGRTSYSAATGQVQETGETERFSMGLIFALDKNDLFRRKRTVQQIYNANYRFAKPPDKPLIKAIAGNGKVTLYWDDRAEKTFDAFYQRYNFEGYRIYMATDPNFLETKVVTDAYGKSVYRKPLAQFDLVDGVTGLHPINVNGAMFYLGDDTGLQHSYVDTTVQNGQTYYYAVVAYDKGFTTTTIQGEFLGIPPSETTSIIKQDVNGTIKTDVNTAAVTPHAPAAGYVPPQISQYLASGPSSGSVNIDIIDPEQLKNNNTYRVEFLDFTKYHNNRHPFYSLINTTTNDTAIKPIQMKGANEQTLVVDGFSVNLNNDTLVTVDNAKSGWVKGNSNYVATVGFDPRYVKTYGGRRIDYPADFEITFLEKGKGDSSFVAKSFSQPSASNITIRNITEGLEHVQFILEEPTGADSMFDANDAAFIVVGDSAGKRATGISDYRVTWSLTFQVDTTIKEAPRPPQPGDVFRIATTKPFRTGEHVDFTTKAPYLDPTKAKNDLSLIDVVPNPYTGAASWEPLTTSVGRGERRINFIHLPAQCDIRIYTMSGKLVQTLSHYSTADNGQEAWNLVSRDGMDIAYGVYIYHVDAPGIGTKIGRFAIIK
ncbi:MAG: hypothetical protein HF314_09870 [Ignavibacteria bacterium]|nr:hypothetical protein [Ignavibacteria bacterium]MCU7518132.1 hypothetical protein [Ignavibacteria bacterium]